MDQWTEEHLVHGKWKYSNLPHLHQLLCIKRYLTQQVSRYIVLLLHPFGNTMASHASFKHARFVFGRKKFIRKWGSNCQNLKKIVRKSRGSISKLQCFYRPKISISSLLHSNVKDGFQIQVYNIINESVNHSSQFISVKVRKNLRKSHAHFREMQRKLRLRQNNDFLIRQNTCSTLWLAVFQLRVVLGECSRALAPYEHAISPSKDYKFFQGYCSSSSVMLTSLVQFWVYFCPILS